MTRHYVILAAGIVAAASSALFIKSNQMPPFTLAALRLLTASALMAPLLLLALRREGRSLGAADWLRALPGGLLLGVHLGTWNMGVHGTSIANATLIVNLNPAVMPVVMYLLMRERITRGETVGSVVSLLGVLVLTAGQAQFGLDSIRGDVICGASMVIATFYFALARVRRGSAGLWVYVVPLYVIAGVTCAAFGVFEKPEAGAFTRTDWLTMLGLAVVPTVIGHSALNYAMTHLPAQQVAIANLGQFAAAAALAWALRGEVPAARFYLAAALIVAGAVVVVRSATPRVRRAIQRAAEEATE